MSKYEEFVGKRANVITGDFGDYFKGKIIDISEHHIHLKSRGGVTKIPKSDVIKVKSLGG